MAIKIKSTALRFGSWPALHCFYFIFHCFIYFVGCWAYFTYEHCFIFAFIFVWLWENFSLSFLARDIIFVLSFPSVLVLLQFSAVAVAVSRIPVLCSASRAVPLSDAIRAFCLFVFSRRNKYKKIRFQFRLPFSRIFLLQHRKNFVPLPFATLAFVGALYPFAFARNFPTVPPLKKKKRSKIQ